MKPNYNKHFELIALRCSFASITPKALERDFVSVSDRMQAEFGADKLDAVLTAIIEDNHWPLCALDNLEAVREVLGLKIPELELVDEPFPEKAVVQPKVSPVPVTPEVVPSPQAAPEEPLKALAAHNDQRGGPEKNAASFLRKAGIADAVMQDQDWSITIENPPYIPLVVERHVDRLHFIHYQTDAADELYIETEAVFSLNQDGTFQLEETATNAGFGESRACDRSFAHIFMRNIHRQGFPEACLEQHRQQRAEVEVEPEVAKQGILFDGEPVPSVTDASDLMWGKPPEVPAIQIVQRSMDDVDPKVGDTLADDPAPAESTSKTLAKLREWYRAARDLHASDLKLDSIKILGLSVRQAAEQQVFHALSTDITQELHQTLDKYKPFQERSRAVAAIAKEILEKVGTRNGQGDMVFTGRTYHIKSVGTTLTVEKAGIDGFKPIVIKKHNSISMATAEATDMKAFQEFAGMLKSYQVKAQGIAR